ncbi:MAG: FKBP-type peptidyl-prolyl cis-trans isomerase [Opitutaceae bacterium]|jgi:FKBP-type peptidyl-prolyl cis-trans isomerase|nr:FKBP-type peptidyl-prolyl cis-trans isomerase [Opitutaceae bacterium]
MKSIHATVLALAAAAVLSAHDAPKPAAAAPATPAFTELQALETLGWVVGKRELGFGELSYTPDQTAAIAKGFAAAAAGKEAPYDIEKVGPQIAAFMKTKGEEYMAKQKAEQEKLAKENAAAAEKFVAETKAKPGVKATDSGLLYEIVQPGSGAFPKATDTVKVHYTGTLIGGQKFDSSIDRGEPAVFPLNQVIPGWTEGLQKIQKGGKIKLYVPAKLGYGDEAAGGIPPGALLIFDVELLDIVPPPAPETKDAPKPADKK